MAKKSKQKTTPGRPHSASGSFSTIRPAWLNLEAGPWRWVLLAVVIWAMLAMVYPDAALRGQIFGSADAGNADAFSAAGDASLRAGHYPLWNPYLFAGMPSFGSLAYVRYLYPPSLVLNLLQDRMGFAPMTWMLAHLIFGGLGMAWLLSRWKLPLAVLVLGAAIWLLNPKVVAWAVHGHGSKLGAAMYLPWIIGWVWRILDGGGGRAVAMVGLLLGLQFLRGHVQITYYTLLAVGWLTVFNVFAPLSATARGVSMALRWRRLALVLAGLALGFMIGAVLLIPVQNYAGVSIRGQDIAGGGGVGMDYATSWSLAPSEVATFVFPAAAGFGKATYMGHMPFTDYPHYFGALLLLLAVAGWWWGDRRLFIALAVMFVLAVLVAFGKFGFGLYDLLYGYLPFFNKFRIPVMILVLSAFGVSILAVLGVDAWRQGRYPAGRALVLPLVLGVIGLIFLGAGGLSLAKDSYQSGLAAMAAKSGHQAAPVLLDEAWLLHRASLVRMGLVLLTAAAALWFSSKHATFRRHGLAWVLVVLVMIDLMGVAKAIVHPERYLQQVGRDSEGRGVLMAAARLSNPPRPTVDLPPGPAADTIGLRLDHQRLWPFGRWSGQNTWMNDGIRSLGGYHPAKLANYEQIRKRIFSDRPAGRLAGWLAGRIVVMDRALQNVELQALTQLGADLDPQPARAGGLWLYTNRAALPRARLVGDWSPVAELPGAGSLGPFLDGVQNGTIAVGNRVYLAESPEPAPSGASTVSGEIDFVRDALDEVVLAVRTSEPAMLVLADMMAPGWQAEVDGRDRPLLTADLVLRAVALPAGEHTVRFHYRDPAVRKGLTLTLLGAAVVLVLLLLPFIRRARPAPEGKKLADE